MNRTLGYASFVVIGLLAACGGATPAPAEPPPAKPAATAETPAPAPQPTAQTTGDAGAPKAPEPEDKVLQPSNKRPTAVYMDATGPQTVGFDGAVFRLTAENAELRIPNGALREPRNVVFVVDRKNSGTKGKLGASYLLDLQVPERQYVMGQLSPSTPEQSRGDKFVVKLPLPAGQQTANLAIETLTGAEGAKNLQSSWTVIEMTKFESAEPANRAVFELEALPDGHVHLTSQGPSTP